MSYQRMLMIAAKRPAAQWWRTTSSDRWAAAIGQDVLFLDAGQKWTLASVFETRGEWVRLGVMVDSDTLEACLPYVHDFVFPQLAALANAEPLTNYAADGQQLVVNGRNGSMDVDGYSLGTSTCITISNTFAYPPDEPTFFFGWTPVQVSNDQSLYLANSFGAARDVFWLRCSTSGSRLISYYMPSLFVANRRNDITFGYDWTLYDGVQTGGDVSAEYPAGTDIRYFRSGWANSVTGIGCGRSATDRRTRMKLHYYVTLNERAAKEKQRAVYDLLRRGNVAYFNGEVLQMI